MLNRHDFVEAAPTPPRRPPDQAASSFTPPLRRQGNGRSFTSIRNNRASWRTHTYSTYARGIDPVNGTYQFLDLVPKGRDEPSDGDPQFWVRRHDEYGS